MSLEQIISGDVEMFGFGKRNKKNDLDLAKAQADPRFNQILNAIRNQNPDINSQELIRIAIEQYKNLPQNLERRDFMKKTAEAGIAAGLMGLGILPKEAKADWESDNLPGGFLNVRPWAKVLKLACIYDIKRAHHDVRTIMRGTKSHRTDYGPLPWITYDELKCEPASWYLMGKYKLLGPLGGLFKDVVENQNITHMTKFAYAISGYFRHIEGYREITYDYVERNFLESIFSAAGYEDYKDTTLIYQRNDNLDHRKKLIVEAYEKIDSLENPDRLSKDPFNSYNKQLTAAWAATWLANFYWETAKNN
jgi:hypothetical protein